MSSLREKAPSLGELKNKKSFEESLVVDEEIHEEELLRQSAIDEPERDTGVGNFLSFMMMSKIKLNMSKRLTKVRGRQSKLQQLQTEFVQQMLDCHLEDNKVVGDAEVEPEVLVDPEGAASRSTRSLSAPQESALLHRMSVFRPRSSTHRAGQATAESIPQLRKQISLPKPKPGTGMRYETDSIGSFRISEERDPEDALLVFRPNSMASFPGVRLAAEETASVGSAALNRQASIDAVQDRADTEVESEAATLDAVPTTDAAADEATTPATPPVVVSTPVAGLKSAIKASSSSPEAPALSLPESAEDAEGSGADAKVSFGRDLLQEDRQLRSPSSCTRSDARLLTIKSMQEVEMRQMIGFGTFGEVRVATIHDGQTVVAVKTMPKEHVENLLQEEHVCQEAGLLAQLDHPFINTMHAAFQDSGHLYLVLELLHGGNLMRLLEEKAYLPEPHVRIYAAQLVSVLKFIHGLNIAFRDLNVTNVMIDRQGYLRLVDWGFAKHIVTESHTFCGTPEYLAPEVIKRLPHNQAVDTWSLGIVVFELLVGKTPFVESASGKKCSTLQIYRRIREGTIVFPPTVSPVATALIGRLCQQAPADRPAMAELVHDPFFAEVDWDRLKMRLLDAPWLPPVMDNLDVSLASTLGEEEEEEEEGLSEEDRFSGEEAESEEAEEQETEDETMQRLADNIYAVIFEPTAPPQRPRQQDGGK